MNENTDSELQLRLRTALKPIALGSKPSGGVSLLECLQSLDRILEEEGKELDPQLRHYLERRSYEKAWVHLEEQSKGR